MYILIEGFHCITKNTHTMYGATINNFSPTGDVIYSVPHTRIHTQMSRYLRDRYLVVWALLLVVPHLLLHALRQLVNPLHFEETTYTVC